MNALVLNNYDFRPGTDMKNPTFADLKDSVFKNVREAVCVFYVNNYDELVVLKSRIFKTGKFIHLGEDYKNYMKWKRRNDKLNLIGEMNE